MGTRNLVAVQVDGEYRTAQYGQWDGYLSGAGQRVLDFVRDPKRVEVLREKARAARWLTDEARAAMNGECGIPPGTEWLTGEQSSARKRLYPQLSRDLGAEVLNVVANAEPGIVLENNIDFAQDSLFCEYAYVVDLDAMRLEVFTGFNKAPVEPGARFSGGPDEGGYYPVRLLAAFALCDLPETFAHLETREGHG